MLNSMTAHGSWTPIQSPASFVGGITESPCKKCRHLQWRFKEYKRRARNGGEVGNLADECMERDDCPLKRQPQQLFCYTNESHRRAGTFSRKNRKPEEGRPYHPCPYEYCGRPTRDIVCWAHRKTYESRLASGITGDNLLKAGKLVKKVFPKRFCEGCGVQLIPRDNEGTWGFRHRRYCSPRCRWGKPKFDIKKALKLRKQGKTIRETGRIMGFSESHVRRSLKENEKKQLQRRVKCQE